MKKIYFSLIPVILSIIFISCNDEPLPSPPLVDDTNNGFESFAVAEIIAKNCATSGCHAGNEPANGLDMSSHSALIKGSTHRDHGSHSHGKIKHEGLPYAGEAVIPYDAENSLLYNLITGNVENQEFRMPYGKAKLPDAEIETIKNWINNGAKDNNGNVPYSNQDKRAYVTAQAGDKVYAIDTDYKLVARILDVNFNLTGIDAPHNIQMHGNYYYVTLVANGEFLKIDKNTNEFIAKATGIQKAGMVVLSPDGNTAYVSRSSTSDPVFNTIYAVNTETMNVIKEIALPVSGIPHAIWLTKDGRKLYVANMSRDRIDVINTTDYELLDEETIVLSQGPSLVHEPMHIYLSPDDNYLYINNRKSSKMLVYRLSDNMLMAELNIKNHPMQSAVSADGNKIYVVSHHEPVITEVTKSGESWSVTNEYMNEIFHHLYGADLTPDGKYLYVSCSNNDPAHAFEPHFKIPGKSMPSLLCIYDVEKKELVKIIDIGSFATGVAARVN